MLLKSFCLGPFAGSSAPDSARSNLAAAFVNGFVNTGFGVDKMMTEAEDASRWFYKNKEYGKRLFNVLECLITKCDHFL